MDIDLFYVAKQSKYPVDAFLFVQRGLEFTARRVHGEPDPKGVPADRHVTGQILSMGLRDFAMQQYGLLARTVLKQWHINSTHDFGQIVFAMVNSGLMQKTPHDSIEDFNDVFDFHQAFNASLEVLSKSKE